MKNYLNNLKNIIDKTSDNNNWEELFQVIVKAFKSGKKVLVCGNGGSASQASHLHGELLVKYNNPKRKELPSVCLSNSGDVITAHTNDFEFKSVFSRQVRALGNEGDVLIAFTTSGKSPNIIEACKTARNKKMIIMGITGNNNNLDSLCDYLFKSFSTKTSHIQEMHLLFIHLLCEKLELEF